MIAPLHHLPEEWLVAEANGSLGAAHSVLVQTHCTLCPPCRSQLDHASSIAASAGLEGEPLQLPDSLWSAIEAGLDEQPEPTPTPESAWPRPVADLVGSLRFRWKAPSLWGIHLPVQTAGNMPLRLLWMAEGTEMLHKDGGEESAVILQGGWSDQTGSYSVGDVYHNPEGHELHEQRIDRGDDCVALVLNAEAVIPPRAWMRWFLKV